MYAQLLASRPMVFLGEISYEIFLIHLVTMELVMVEILRFPIYTGSMAVLFVATFVVTVPAGLAAAPVHPRPLGLCTIGPTASVRLSCPK